MKKFYEINIACRGAVETHTFETKKAKNEWLVNYLTKGKGAGWGRAQYQRHLEEKALVHKRPMSFERYILYLVKDIERLSIRTLHEIIIIREKTFEKI